MHKSYLWRRSPRMPYCQAEQGVSAKLPYCGQLRLEESANQSGVGNLEKETILLSVPQTLLISGRFGARFAGQVLANSAQLLNPLQPDFLFALGKGNNKTK